MALERLKQELKMNFLEQIAARIGGGRQKQREESDALDLSSYDNMLTLDTPQSLEVDAGSVRQDIRGLVALRDATDLWGGFDVVDFSRLGGRGAADRVRSDGTGRAGLERPLLDHSPNADGGYWRRFAERLQRMLVEADAKYQEAQKLIASAGFDRPLTREVAELGTAAERVLEARLREVERQLARAEVALASADPDYSRYRTETLGDRIKQLVLDGAPARDLVIRLARVRAQLTSPGFRMGDQVEFSPFAQYAADWRGWTGFIAGCQVSHDGKGTLTYTVSDVWPPRGLGSLTDGIPESDLVAIPYSRQLEVRK